MRTPFLLIFLSIISFAQICAQRENLQLHANFFQSQMQEYDAWTKSVHLDELATFKKVITRPDKVTFYFKSTFTSDDSLKVAWKAAQYQYYQKHRGRIGERMFDQLAFQCDLELDQLEILILGNEYENTNIRIFHSENYLQVEENFPNVFSNSTLEESESLNKIGGRIFSESASISLERLNVNALINENGQRTISVEKVRRYLGNYLQRYYQNKGTSWYKAHIDTTRAYYNKLLYRVTCLNNEVIQDGYFEYLQIKLEVTQQGDQIKLNFGLMGKYASGLICPRQKTKFYKSMETYYPKELEEYAEHLHNKLKDQLRQYP